MATEQENTAQIEDVDLYDEAIATEAKEAPPQEPEATEPAEAAPAEEPKSKLTELKPVEDTEPEKESHRVPLAELLNTRERAQKAEAEREQFKQQLWALQQQLQGLQPEPEPVDMFAEPEKYQQSIQELLQQNRREMEGNFSLRLARATHKEVFDKAWQEMVNRTMNGDDSMRQQVLQSSDPGETLIGIYKKEQIYSQVGEDPESFVQRKLEEALDNPEFLAKALEKAKQVAGGNSSAPNVKLPPSLSKATASSATKEAQPTDSDKDLYSFATQ